PVLQIREQHSMLGGAGNAVRNLDALGRAVRLVSVTGTDAAAEEIEAALRALPTCEWFLAREPLRDTTVKTRFVADSQQMSRADFESKHELTPRGFDEAVRSFEQLLEGASIALLCDYAK